MGSKPYLRLRRRDFLRAALCVGSAWALGIPWAGAQAPGKMRTRAIPSSDETLPVVGLGTSRTFDVGTSAEEREPLKQVLTKFVELGGRLVDTSPMYGNAEMVIGELATELGLQDRLFFATKVWTSGKESGLQQMTASLRKLRSGNVDLMQVHNLVDTDTHLETLRKWKAEGRIRYIGITHYRSDAFADLAEVMRNADIDFVQLNYSLIEPEAEQTLLPLADERGIAVIVNRPFARGELFRKTRGRPLPDWTGEFDCQSWAQFFLKYVLSHPAVTCAIPATSDPQHLADNMQAGYGRLPDAAQRARMLQHVRAL